jgi:beta-galactosidase
VPPIFRNRGVSLVAFCLLALLPIGAAFAAAPEAIPISGERRVNFDGDWRFFKGEAENADRPDFDDSQWRQVRLPHDWAIEGPFDSKLNPHTGALPIFGTGWYRKTFTIPQDGKGRYFWVEFDGAMANSRVWINGKEMGGRPYGYIGFGFDLTAYLHFGGEPNVLAVRLTPEDRSSRWYPGAGIYRNVWMDVTGPIHIGRWGTYVTTPQVTADKSAVSVKTEVQNQSDHDAEIMLQTSVLDAGGNLVSRNLAEAEFPAGSTQVIAPTLTVTKPQRWDTEHPYLYTVVSEVMQGERVVDRYTTTFGIRTIAFDKDKGFLLNGRYLKIQGVCNHSDLGALGAAVNWRATERQLEIMKGAGANAVRTAHNPPSPELLELCDRMGLLVIDESFDMWRVSKIPNGNGYSKYFEEWSERDVRDMVRRDRNHPSIFMYSIGNEIPEQARADGWQEAKRLTGLFHQEDPTRPTTSAFNSWANAIKNKLADEVDVPGFNYASMRYEQIMKDHPNWVIYGSETGSCLSSRGVYQLPIQKYEKDPSLEISSYDIIAPPWAYCPDVEFFYQDKFPQVLGEFVWTGFDYIGEPTPYFQGRNDPAEWPARSSYFGMVDLAGFPKDRYYLYQSRWTSKPMVHLLPHWNWPGHEGQAIPVMAYTNADEVELFLNGKSLGRKKRFSEPVELPVGPNVSPDRKFMSKYRLEWQVPYRPGDLKAVAYRNGKQVAVDDVRTAGAPARVKISADHTSILADGEDLSFLTVRIEDRDGNLCPLADNLVEFHVAGAGSIAGVDNGNAATVEPFQADHRKAFSGMALLIVRSKSGEAGRIHIAATSEGLAAAVADVTTRK